LIINGTCAVVELDANSNDPCDIESFSDEDVTADTCDVVGYNSDELLVIDDTCIIVGLFSDDDTVFNVQFVVGYVPDDVAVTEDTRAFPEMGSAVNSVLDENCVTVVWVSEYD
ncbi:hypothetical protein chiPu_0028807, partial [Chiloscyllium punctatum]|nr:hypothetical protein [Chiloscyllium punctatum]